MQADQADDVPAAEEQPAPESPPAAEEQPAPGSPPVPAALGQPVALTLDEQNWIQEEEKQSFDAFRYEIS